MNVIVETDIWPRAWKKILLTPPTRMFPQVSQVVDAKWCKTNRCPPHCHTPSTPPPVIFFWWPESCRSAKPTFIACKPTFIASIVSIFNGGTSRWAPFADRYKMESYVAPPSGSHRACGGSSQLVSNYDDRFRPQFSGVVGKPSKYLYLLLVLTRWDGPPSRGQFKECGFSNKTKHMFFWPKWWGNPSTWWSLQKVTPNKKNESSSQF